MDMLVKLYRLPSIDIQTQCAAKDLVIRAPIGPECERIFRWVEQEFGLSWASEARVAMQNNPLSILIALQADSLIGFACYDATARGFFGPIGLIPRVHRLGVGSLLLLTTLQRMRTVGYGYAIVGKVGVPEFFRRVAGAAEIADSDPGIYAHNWQG